MLGSQDIEYAVLYTAPEAFAGTVAHIRHHRSSAEAMARSENNHPQHPDLRCHVVTRTVTYSEWTPIETGSG